MNNIIKNPLINIQKETINNEEFQNYYTNSDKKSEDKLSDSLRDN